MAIFFLLPFSEYYAAQEVPHFREKLTAKESPSNKINDITRDDHGYLWIAATGGLNFFRCRLCNFPL
jgi:ligand-binding sensor domain-containing protein